MRKVLSFVLVLSLVLGSFGSVFAAASVSNFADVAGTDYEDAVNVLVDLEVVSGYEDGTYKPENIVTRAEMAILVVKAMGMDDFVADQKSSFTDMTNYGWAEGYITYAQGMGIISGYGDGTFQPGRTVSYDEAVTMLVAALGYTAESLTGTWPANYTSKARALGILDDITASSAGANRGDVAIMIYQTLTVPIGTVDNDGIWTAINKGSRNEQVDDTMLKRLGAEEMNEGDAFVITNAIADDAVVNVRNLVGAYVKAYENKDGELIAISELKSVFLTGEVDENKFDTGAIEYNLSNGNAVNTMAVFENGIDISDAVADANIKEKIVVGNKEYDLTDNPEITIAADVNGKTIREVYSVSIWDAEDHFQFESAMATEIKNDQELNGYEFKLDDYDEIDYSKFQLLGVDTLEDISVDDVVFIYVDGDDEITRVEVGTETVSGEVTRVRNKTELTIGGTVYKISDPSDADDEEISAGDEVKLFLTYGGRYYAVDAISGGANDYAIVVGLAQPGDGTNTIDSARLQLFLNDGTTKTFSVDEEEVEDYIGYYKLVSGEWEETTEADSEAVRWKFDKGAIVKYGVDKSGDIDALEVPEVDKTLTKINDGKTAEKDISARGYYDGKLIANNAAIFIYDGTTLANLSNIKSSDLSVSTPDKVKGLDDVSAHYVTNKDNRIVAMLIDGDATSDDEVYGVVYEYGTNNSDAGGWATFYINGKKVTYDVKESITKNGLNSDYVASLVELKFDTNGDVSSLNQIKFADAVWMYAVGDGTTSYVLDENAETAQISSNMRTYTLKEEGGTATERFTLDSTNYVYIKNGTSKWDTTNLKAIETALKDYNKGEKVKIYFMDAVDEDEVVETVLIVYGNQE